MLFTTICVYFVYPEAYSYYLTGGILHIALDMLNNPFRGHGVWLFYPIRKGDGFAAGACKAARTGNKVFYFIGIIAFACLSGCYAWLIGDWVKCIPIVVILAYMVVVLHFVRTKSEMEQRRIMHINGEL